MAGGRVGNDPAVFACTRPKLQSHTICFAAPDCRIFAPRGKRGKGYGPPQEYWFVTHRGVTSDFQDLLDVPEKLRAYMLENRNERCASKISKQAISLTTELKAHIGTFDFSIFRAKQPLDLINEHAQTRYHLTVFGAPLIERPPPPTPPSAVAAGETEYVSQLYKVIGEALGKAVSGAKDFSSETSLTRRVALEAFRSDEIQATSLRSLKDRIESTTKGASRPTKEWEPLPSTSLRKFCDEIESVLKEWHWEGEGRVEFDESEYDIKVDGQRRQSHGKGVRAILHSAFVIGLLRYCQADGSLI